MFNLIARNALDSLMGPLANRILARVLMKADVTAKLNTDFGIAGMSTRDLQAVVAAWQSGPISSYTMFELLRSGEILPDGRTNEDEANLIGTGANREHGGKN
jgi:hypothetical protein